MTRRGCEATRRFLYPIKTLNGAQKLKNNSNINSETPQGRRPKSDAEYKAHFHAVRRATTEPVWARVLLIAATFAFLTFFLLFPLICVFYEALADGLSVFWRALIDKDTMRAMKMTFVAAFFSVFLNVVFGLAAAWCIGKFQFWGKGFLLSLIDLPFAISPVIAGLLFLFLFCSYSPLGRWLMEHNVRVVFATPGVVIATIFVTFPFVVRELIPVMEAQGTEEEQAARVLGANGWQIFTRVTLPNVKWALLYGAILCNARAMGEFGAVSVVAGKVAKTNTAPLHIEDLQQSYAKGAEPFAVASLLAAAAILTLVAKAVLEWKMSRTGEE